MRSGRLGLKRFQVPDFRFQPCLQGGFHFAWRVLAAHAVDGLAITIQRNEMAGVHFVPVALWNKLKQPALRAGCTALDVQTIGARGGIEEHSDRSPRHGPAVTAALQEEQLILEQGDYLRS